jgi:hypothetical protein
MFIWALDLEAMASKEEEFQFISKAISRLDDILSEMSGVRFKIGSE